jgi:hypothetical protein
MSLFPFLDTLVCTMGALILMLLAMTPKIKERALARQAAAQAPAADPVVEPDPEPEPVSEPNRPALTAVPAAPPEDDRAAERQRRRDAWLAQAADARSALGKRTADFHLSRQQIKDAEQQLRDVQDRILTIQLKAENSGHAGADLDERAQQLEAKAAVIAQKIAATRKNIDLVNRRQAVAKNEYSLVAYDGTSGTLRRPIYIECTGKGFRFLPASKASRKASLRCWPAHRRWCDSGRGGSGARDLRNANRTCCCWCGRAAASPIMSLASTCRRWECTGVTS